MGAGLGLTLALALILILGTGCGHKMDRRQTLEFWTISLHPTYDAYIHGLMSRFSATHPGVRLEWIDVPIDVVMQKLMASIAGGVPPDLVNLNSTYAMVMAQNNALVNMDQAVPEEARDRYFPGIWRAAYYKGANYAIPWYVSTPVLMYNKSIFKAAGLDPDHPPTSLEEMGRYGRIIHQRTGYYGFMPSIKDVNKLLDEWQTQGIPVLSPDKKQALFANPQAAASLEWYARLFQDGIIPPETLTQGYQGAVDRYKSGNLAMLLAGPQFLLRIRKDAPGVYAQTGVAPYPTSSTNQVPAGVMNFVVPRSSPRHELAVELALFLTDDENQLQFCLEVPLLPSTRQAAADPRLVAGTGFPKEDLARRTSVAQLTRARDMSLGLKDWPRLGRLLEEQVGAVLYGRKAAKDALESAARQWDKILAEP